jgi:hypothetical protein
VRTVLGRVRLQKLGASRIAEHMEFDVLDERMILTERATLGK